MSKSDDLLNFLLHNIGKWSCSVCGSGSNQPAATFRTVKNMGYRFEEVSPNRWGKMMFCEVCGTYRTHYKLLSATPEFVEQKRLGIDPKSRKRILELLGGRDAFSGASIASTPEIDHKVPWTRLDEDIVHDSEFDTEDYLIKHFAKSFGKAEENAFINGTGVNMPIGILNGTDGA